MYSFQGLIPFWWKWVFNRLLDDLGVNGCYSGVSEHDIQAATLHITPEILALIAEIDEFKGEWRARHGGGRSTWYRLS